MEIIRTTSIASVEIAEVKVSIDELAVYETAITKILESMNESEVLSVFGATKDELEGIRDDVSDTLEVCHKSQKTLALA
jgi:hypothetical protein